MTVDKPVAAAAAARPVAVRRSLSLRTDASAAEEIRNERNESNQVPSVSVRITGNDKVSSSVYCDS